MMTSPATKLRLTVTTKTFLWLVLSLFVSSASLLAGGLAIENLRCEYLENPLGIEAAKPRLQWTVASRERDQLQSAYQILVASTEKLLKSNKGDLWDSGKVASGETIQIPYGGTPLLSSQRCFWKVRVWDKENKASSWSRTASWEMGLLKLTDWKGKWIGRTTDTNSNPAPLFRRAFAARDSIASARLYICGLGYYEAYINGKRVGDQILDPGYTRFDRRALYVTHDVTSLVRKGDNAIGIILGNGWYNVHTKAVWNFHEAPWRSAPKMLVQLRLDYADGRTEFVTSDESWKTSTGPIVFDSIYGGETYDARLEKPGWDTVKFNDSKWTAAQVVTGVAGKVSSELFPPIRMSQTLKPVRITEPKKGVFIVDIDQNLAGFAELTVKGPAGTTVRMRYGERLNPDGTLDTADISQHVMKKWPEQQFQTDTYILKGTGTEKWHARFCYHGFQYVEITGFPGRPTLDNLRAIFIHSDVPKTGTFECSNPLLNRVQRNTLWSFLSNLQGIPTDCPHREKNGWTGDAHLAAEQAMYNFFPAAVHAKWVQDLADEQRPTGELPGIVPTSGWGYSWGNGPAWDSAFLLIPFYLHQYYGDTESLRRQYPGMKQYVDYLTSKANNGIVSIGLNDWAPYKTKTDGAVTSTAYYYVDARIVALAARLLGNSADEQKYNELADSIRTAFNRVFYKPDISSYDKGSQTALSCALYQGMVAPENKERVVNSLVAAVEKTGNHLDVGILGCKYLLNSLLENNRDDVAWKIVTQTNQPGWIHWMNQNATTLWEQWNGTESRNHIMFGDVSAWFYKALAGIRPDPAAPGFKHFFIKPYVPAELNHVKASYQSIRGLIRSEWKVVKGQFELDVVIPANTTATVWLPIKNDISESGKVISSSPDMKYVKQDGRYVVYEVGSGDYHFSGLLAR